MSEVDVSASAILTEALSICADAKDIGLNMPKHVSVKFRNILASPQYRDVLSRENLDPTQIGYLLGNRHRWDQKVCKYFTLRFLKFFMVKASASQFLPEKLVLQYSLPKTPEFERLSAYDAQGYSRRFAMFGPSVFLNNNRYISIKLQTEYPNVTKGVGEYQQKWINMRYTKNISTGNVMLQPVPEFTARRKEMDKTLETRGQIRNQNGEIAKFSYCMLASAFKEICDIALKMLVGAEVPTNPDSIAFTPFDILNLIQKRNFKFRIVLQPVVDSLFPPQSPENVVRGYRINGDADLFFLFGTSEDISNVVEIGEVYTAYNAEVFRLSQYNVCGQVGEDDSEAYGILFKVERFADLEAEDKAFWDAPVRITEYEILDEDGILNVFGF